MRKLFVSEFLTVDGVMQAPGASDEDMEGGFQHGGWQLAYFDDVFAKSMEETMGNTGAFVLGRKTYEIFAAYWPTAKEEVGEFADLMNEMPKYVASKSLRPPLEWQNSTLLEGDVGESITALKQEEGKDLQVIGSGNLAASLMRLGMVDEFRLMIHPLVLGSGRRLFPEGLPRIPLRLLDSKTTSTGVLIVTYGMESPGDSVARRVGM
ncbi:MAG TPA: dihydrofolate reductase family protein [Actinomycetota bacterium]|jgi:dihydrofolate reductase|nr:dihydrofolate reductase family protein [Actinomycetota bacterium]